MLEVKNLCAGYGRDLVLDSINFGVQKGRLISVIGPNGSGKSTLLKSVTGILKPISGEVSIDGIAIENMKSSERAQKLAYLPQGRNLPDMTVEQLVLHGRFPYMGYPRRYTEKDHIIAREAMEKMNVYSMAGRNLASLSGGMRQKVYIAMALCQDTDYILLDEPTTYLDVSCQLDTMTTLRNLAKEGKGIAVVMHDLAFAFEFSDEIVVLNEGKILIKDTPANLCANGIIKDVFGVELMYSTEDKCYYYKY